MLCFSIILSVLFSFSTLKADGANDALDSLKGMWDGASKFVTGMGQAFGYVPDDYEYSSRFFNDSAQRVAFAKQKITKVLGAGFSGAVSKLEYYDPFQNSKESFGKEGLYYTLWMLVDKSGSAKDYKSMVEDYTVKGAEYGVGLGAAIGALIGAIKTTQELDELSIYQRTISTPDTKNWYYYRAYTDKGVIKGEYLGIKSTSSEFSGVFYNSSSVTDIFLEFIKDDKTYKVALEPKTFSLLNSTQNKATSIRPAQGKDRAFNFYQGTTPLAAIPVGSEGICNMEYDEKTKKFIPSSPMVYTYEVYTDKSQKTRVGLQGLAVGHYDQPVGTNVIRDINPIECHLWYQSPKQAQEAEQKEAEKKKQSASNDSIYSEYKEQIWIFYKSKDYTYQQKITSGKVIDFTLIRPRISEKTAQLYVAAINSTEDKKSLDFLNRLADKLIGEKLNEAVTAIKNFDENTVITTMQTSSIGIIDDTQAGGSGVKGYILLADTFDPRGMGTGPFYYSLKPMMLYLSQLVDTLNGFLDPKKFDSTTTMDQGVMEKITDWVQRYAQESSKVTTEVTSYVMQNGMDGIFENKDRKTLNARSQAALQDLITGTVSIQNVPNLKQAGSSLFVYNFGAKPDGWPQ